MQKEFLTDRETAQYFGVSKATVWRFCKQPDFPQPIKLGPSTTRWKRSDLESYADRLRGQA
jgi:prophage regulatory protein